MYIFFKTKESNHDIAHEVLNFYSLDEKGNRIGLKDRGRKKMEGEVNKLSVALTGARAGYVLIGASKGTKGAIIRIHSDDVPPQKRTLDGVRYYPDLWNKFLVKLGSVPYFTNMSILSREIWLDINEANNENSIGQEGVKIQLVQPGESLLIEKLTDEDLAQLIQGNPARTDGYWTYDLIENFIPRKAGSKARRHTLFLIRSFWKLAIDYEVATEFKDITIKIKDGIITNNKKAKINEEIFIIGSITKNLIHKKKGKQDVWVRPIDKNGVQNIGLLVDKNRISLDDIDSIIYEMTNIDIKPIRKSMYGFTGAAYKSLLQKIIRFRPTKIDIGHGKLYDAETVLLVCMGDLAAHPGALYQIFKDMLLVWNHLLNV